MWAADPQKSTQMGETGAKSMFAGQKRCFSENRKNVAFDGL
jgi:hypothetical protein